MRHSGNVIRLVNRSVFPPWESMCSGHSPPEGSVFPGLDKQIYRTVPERQRVNFSTQQPGPGVGPRLFLVGPQLSPEKQLQPARITPEPLMTTPEPPRTSPDPVFVFTEVTLKQGNIGAVMTHRLLASLLQGLGPQYKALWAAFGPRTVVCPRLAKSENGTRLLFHQRTRKYHVKR